MLGHHPGPTTHDDRTGNHSILFPRWFSSMAVVQPKGGVGKTTIAVNLACGLAQAGMRTLLIDTDPLGSASRYLGQALDDGPTVADVVTGRAGVALPGTKEADNDIEAAVDRIFGGSSAPPTATHAVPHVPGLFLIPSSRSLSRTERKLADPFRLRNALSRVDPGQLDAVVVDTPPRWDLLTINALAAVRIVIAPIELKPLSLMAVSRLTDGMSKIRQRCNEQLDPLPWIVPSRVRHAKISDRCLQDLAESFPGRMLPSIRESTRIAEAPGFRLPVRRFAPRSIGSDDFDALTEATLERVLRVYSPEWAAPC